MECQSSSNEKILNPRASNDIPYKWVKRFIPTNDDEMLIAISLCFVARRVGPSGLGGRCLSRMRFA
jgi:hypothetical protein